MEIEDDYTQQLGKLIFTKSVKGPVTQEEAEGALTFTVTTVIDNKTMYVQKDGTVKETPYTFHLNDKYNDERIFKVETDAEGNETYTATFDKLPIGQKFTVTETNTTIVDEYGNPYKLAEDTVTSKESDEISATPATVEIEDVYTQQLGKLVFTKSVKGPVSKAEA